MSPLSVNKEVYDLNWGASQEVLFEDGVGYEGMRWVERMKPNRIDLKKTITQCILQLLTALKNE